MRISTIAISFLVLVFIAFFQLPVYGEMPLAVVGGTVVGGASASPLTDSVVLMSKGRIVAVGKNGEVAIPTGSKIVDARGMTVLPGLIDIHVHLSVLAAANDEEWSAKYGDQLRTKVFPSAALALLKAGVTTARDVGASVDDILWFKEQINSGAVSGPRLFVAGPFLQDQTVRGLESLMWRVDGPEDGKRKVRRLAKRGVDLIKTKNPGLSQEELTAIYDEAHSLGLRVASHVSNAAEVRTALLAGLGNYDTLEHIGQGVELSYADDIIKMVVQQKAVVAPTFSTYEGFRLLSDDLARLDSPEWRSHLPKELYGDVRQSYLKRDLSQHYLFAWSRGAFRKGRVSKLRQLYSAGAIFSIASDAGAVGAPHHLATWREMALLKNEVGLKPAEVVAAATRTNAIILGMANDIGTIEPGKLGDAIIVDADLLRDIPASPGVRHVIKGGILIR